MTRTTLKALWVGGGGVLATWLAVSPNPSAPDGQCRRTCGVPLPSASRIQAAELNAQATRLRDRTAAVATASVDTKSFHIQARPKPAPPPARARRATAWRSCRPCHSTPPAAEADAGWHRAERRWKAHRDHLRRGARFIWCAKATRSRAATPSSTIDPEAVLLRDAAGAEHGSSFG